MQKQATILFFLAILCAVFFTIPLLSAGFLHAQTLSPDINKNGTVDIQDLGILLSNWNQTGTNTADLNGSGAVDIQDLGILLSAWGTSGVSTPTPTVTSAPTATLTPTVTPASSNVTPLFSDDFESYVSGGAPTRNAGAFSWGGPGYTIVSHEMAFAGQNSLKFSYGPYEPNGDTHWWSEMSFDFVPSKEIWVEYEIYYPDGTEGVGSARYAHASGGATNNKFMAWWGGPRGSRLGYNAAPAGNFSTWRLGVEDSSIGAISVVADSWGDSDMQPFIVGDADRGRWINVRMQIRVPDYGQSNGIFRLWKDGVLLTEDLGETARTASSADDYLSNGYLLGYDNANYERDTWIYIDDFKFYTTNPGW